MPVMSLGRYREIEVRGGAREMGRQIGEAAGEEIRGFCAVALERVNRTATVSRKQAMRVARSGMDAGESYGPDSMEELRGVAEGAGVLVGDLMLLQVRNQFTAQEDAGL